MGLNHPRTRVIARLLGPCFKTGRRQPFPPGSKVLHYRHRRRFKLVTDAETHRGMKTAFAIPPTLHVSNAERPTRHTARCVGGFNSPSTLKLPFTGRPRSVPWWDLFERAVNWATRVNRANPHLPSRVFPRRPTDPGAFHGCRTRQHEIKRQHPRPEDRNLLASSAPPPPRAAR